MWMEILYFSVAPGIYRQNLGNPARGDTAHKIPVTTCPGEISNFFYKALFLHEFCVQFLYTGFCYMQFFYTGLFYRTSFHNILYLLKKHGATSGG